MYMRIFNTSSRLGQYHSLTQVLTQYQYQFQYQKCSIPIPKISSIEFPGGALSPANFTEHLMNTFGQAQSRIWKQSSVSCKKPKLNYFWNRCSFATRSVLYLRIPLTYHEQSDRSQVRYSRESKRLSSKSKDEEFFSEKVILSQFTRKM